MILPKLGDWLSTSMRYFVNTQIHRYTDTQEHRNESLAGFYNNMAIVIARYTQQMVILWGQVHWIPGGGLIMFPCSFINDPRWFHYKLHVLVYFYVFSWGYSIASDISAAVNAFSGSTLVSFNLHVRMMCPTY